MFELNIIVFTIGFKIVKEDVLTCGCFCSTLHEHIHLDRGYKGMVSVFSIVIEGWSLSFEWLNYVTVICSEG